MLSGAFRSEKYYNPSFHSSHQRRHNTELRLQWHQQRPPIWQRQHRQDPNHRRNLGDHRPVGELTVINPDPSINIEMFFIKSFF